MCKDKITLSIDSLEFAQPRGKYTQSEAWIDLIVQSQKRNNVFRGRIVPNKGKRLAIGLNSLGNRWGWSTSKVRRFLIQLIELEKIKVESKTNLATTIILKY